MKSIHTDSKVSSFNYNPIVKDMVNTVGELELVPIHDLPHMMPGLHAEEELPARAVYLEDYISGVI